jgi:hypothetical protein
VKNIHRCSDEGILLQIARTDSKSIGAGNKSGTNKNRENKEVKTNREKQKKKKKKSKAKTKNPKNQQNKHTPKSPKENEQHTFIHPIPFIQLIHQW